MSSCCVKAGFGVFKLLSCFTSTADDGIGCIRCPLHGQPQASLCVRWPLRISDISQLLLRVWRGTLLAKVDGQSSHAFVRVLEFEQSRMMGRFATAAVLCAGFGLRGLLDTQRVLDALLALLYSLLIVAEPGAMSPTSLRGSVTHLSCRIRNIRRSQQLSCVRVQLVDLFVLSAFALATLSQREWFILTVPRLEHNSGTARIPQSS